MNAIIRVLSTWLAKVVSQVVTDWRRDKNLKEQGRAEQEQRQREQGDEVRQALQSARSASDGRSNAERAERLRDYAESKPGK